MSTIELKSQIIEKISSIEDKTILEEIYNLLIVESEIDSVYTLTEEEKGAVEAGLNDIKNGKVVSSEKANELIKEWLKK